MEIILIRHTKVNVPKGTCYGQTDVAVADTFQQEATLTRSQLQRYEPFDAVFSSPLTRARQLAAFCGYHHPTLDDRLKEMSMGEWEMMQYDDIRDPRIDDWYKDYINLPTPGGESFTMLYQRVAAFLYELKAMPFKRVAIFAHGGVLACAGIYGGLFSQEHAFQNLTDFGGHIRIEI